MEEKEIDKKIDEFKNDLNDLSNKFEQFVGKGVQYGLNKFLDTQEGKGTSLSGLFGSTLN